MIQPGDQPNAPTPDSASRSGYTPPPGYPPTYPPATGYPGAPRRPGTPGSLIAAGVVLLVLAVLALLWAILFGLYGAMIGSVTSVIQNNPERFNLNVSDVSGLMDSLRPVLIGLAVVAVLVALGHAAAGIGVIGRRGWARITGLVLGGLGLAVNLLALVVILIGFGSARPVTNNGITVDPVPTLITGTVIVAAFALAYGFVVMTLARRGADFG
ncbi:MAG: hypothetical protein M3P14_11805 [Chloroflexota bacterium]|nr:hypothetical protein [Chloroflexota bacterium]